MSDAFRASQKGGSNMKFMQTDTTGGGLKHGAANSKTGKLGKKGAACEGRVA